jgi:hypothetical protein
MTDISVAGAKYGISVSTKVKPAQDKKETEKELPDFVQKYIQTDDKVNNSKVSKGEIPQTDKNISKSFNSENNILDVGNHTYSNIKKITNGLDLEEAKKIVKDNKIDEIFFKTEEGELYVAYGNKENKGSLNMDSLKDGYIGKFGDKTVKVVHIDNETNTVKEGALSPINSTWKHVKEAGTSGVAKGITEMGTTLVAIFVGKSVIENGITAVSTAKNAGQVVKGGVDIIGTGTKIVGNAGKTGKAIAVTVGSGLEKLAIGGLVAGAVVGTIVGTMSAYGAIKARNPKNDFTTIDMITNPKLSFATKAK